MSETSVVVAIDGPGGSGKSTVARAVASALGLEWLDTGAMYRAVTLAALRGSVPLDDDAALGALAEALQIDVAGAVHVNGEDVSEAIRSAEVNAAVSHVAANPSVRRILVARQRAWVERRGGGVVEGRDITSVVLPDADVKIYLTASEDERARRRNAEEEAEGQVGTLDETRATIAKRDELDASRTVSPLLVAPGAVVIDSTGRPASAIADEIVALLTSTRSR